VNPYHYEIAKLQSNKAQILATVAKQKATYLDFVKNKQVLMENMRASMSAVTELDEQLAGLIAEHGNPPELTLDDLEGMS